MHHNYFLPPVSIKRKRSYLWRAVDSEGEALEILVQSRRNKRAALKLMKKLLKKQDFVLEVIITDKLPLMTSGVSNDDMPISFNRNNPSRSCI